MLLSLFRRAFDLYSSGNKNVFPDFGGQPCPIVPVIQNGLDVSLADYSRLTDITVWSLVEVWRRSEDIVLADLSARLLTRRLLKTIPITTVDFNKTQALKEKAEAVTADVLGSAEFVSYYVAVDDQSRTSYKGYDFTPENPDESIWLTGGGGADRPLEDDPDSAIVKALKNQMHFPRLVVLDEVRAKLTA